MFPTRGKSKIAAYLAYPVNAKLISEALADVPQAPDLSISFLHLQSAAALRKRSLTYSVLDVGYWYHKASQFTPHYFEEAGKNDPKWSITVQPVPSEIKHLVKELIQNEALPKIRAWLFAKTDLFGKQELQSLTVLFNEITGELQYKEHLHQ